MKRLLLIALLTLPLAAVAAEAPAPQPDYQAIATLLRQQRDAAIQQAQDEAVQIALLQQQVKADEAKIADLQKQAKPASKAKKWCR